MNPRQWLLFGTLLSTATVAWSAEPTTTTNAATAPQQVWQMHDMNRPAPRVVTPGAQFSQLAPPPADAPPIRVAPDTALALIASVALLVVLGIAPTVLLGVF